MKMTKFFTSALAIFFTVALSAQEVSLPRLAVQINSDSSYNVEIVLPNTYPQSVTRYASLSLNNAISVVKTWVENKARARAAAQYDLILAQLAEWQAANDAKAAGIDATPAAMQAILLRSFAGSWRFKPPGQNARKISITADDGEIEGLEQEGTIVAGSAYEVTLSSGGASLRFVSKDGNIFAALFGGGVYILERINEHR